MRIVKGGDKAEVFGYVPLDAQPGEGKVSVITHGTLAIATVLDNAVTDAKKRVVRNFSFLSIRKTA
ncbi:MAG: hypothetical protein FWD91_04625 [Treponema sp.]|nr:hypothetical protein [Treponema sp.]